MKNIIVEYTSIEWLQNKLPNCQIIHSCLPQYMVKPHGENLIIKDNIIHFNKKEISNLRANALIPKSTSIPLFYFEIYIIDHGSSNYIGIGLSSSSHSLKEMPGFLFFLFFFLF